MGTGLDPASPGHWPKPVTLLASRRHTQHVCVCSEGVIKFKLHSDFVMKNERGGNEKLT